ncbi:MAG: TatD family hydrolase [Paludibacteraceae bacterium]|nr:TatD family hydrolase [Paludibacteraceae bacterium]
MIDTHSHIYDPAFDEDREEAIERAKKAGVTKLLLPNVDLNTIQPMLETANKHNGFMACAMGLHPTELNGNWANDLKTIRKELESRPYTAIGEIGIDLYWDKTYIEEQKQAFRQQILWALELDLPVILHIRKAHAEVFEVLNSLHHDRFKGVFHCFGGGIEEARKAVSLGFSLGIGGVLTYKNSRLPDTVKEIGLDHILTETDDPYLPPVPFRGKRNEPAFMEYVVTKLADIFDENAELIDEITTFNARKTFNI